MVKLKDIEVEILLDIYEMDMSNGEMINDNNYNLIEKNFREKRHEFASYLIKLERLKFIEFDGQAFLTGGQLNRKYNNNVIMVWGERIHITEKGIEVVEEAKKTLTTKAADKAVNIGKVLYGEAKDILVKIIIEKFK